MKILIVDDLKINLDLLQAVLERSGYEVTSARNGIEALERLKKDSIDMIISDVLMPKMDGFALCRECKRHDALRKIPFIFYSGTYTREEDRKLALGLGAERFIAKPMEIKPLMEIIEDVFKDYNKDLPDSSEIPAQKADLAFFKEHNERLIEKLSRKMYQLEESERALQERTYDLNKRVKELNCLYGISKLVEKPGISLGEIAQGVVDLIPSAWQRPDIICARAFLDGQEFRTENFRETPWNQVCNIIAFGDRVGGLEVYYLEEKPERGERPFLKEDQDFIIDITKQLGRITERIHAEKTFKAAHENLKLSFKRRAEALQESEEKFRTVADFAHDWEGWIGPERNHLYVSPSCEWITGYGPEEFLINPDLHSEIVHPEDQKAIVEHHNEKFTDEGTYHHEFRITNKRGEVRWIEHVCYHIQNEDGRWLGRRYSNRDITKRKTAERSLSESEARYRTFAENLPGIVYRISIRDNRMHFLNDMLPVMTGFKEAELEKGGTCSIGPFISAEDRDKVTSTVRTAVEDKMPFDVDYRFIHKSGDIKWFREIGRPIFETDGEPLYIDGIVFDITGRKQMEEEKAQLQEQLRQAQRMEAMGTLAGGIAHEFNNILWIISANAEFALNILPEGNKVRKNLQRIEKSCFRASDLVKQILSFSRQEKQAPRPSDIRPIVKETLKFIRSSLPTTIEIKLEIPSQLGMVRVDPTQIHQVITNLCTNAFDAMRKEGGELEVSLADTELEQDTLPLPLGLAPGRYVRMRVKDTGLGMDQVVMKRIFEPFFTTKPVGKGTGMGLSVVHGIVQSYHGGITVDSEPGKGAVFDVFLPVIEDKPKIEVRTTKSVPTGKERILFVDDEVEIVESAREILEDLGYQVESENSPVEALRMFREQPDRFSLVITDMTMPRMTGEMLARELLLIRSDIPIIMCTGYGELITGERAKEAGIKEIIMKPARISNIAEAIRRVLDEK